MELKHIGLFEGIGGFSLAAEMMGWNTMAQCEILPFAQKVLKYHFPNAIQHGDIKTTDFSVYRGKCDILTGGFPCQGFSVAGLRLGTDDNRYLWPEYLRAIDEIQPPFVLGENVTGILSMEDKSSIYRDVFPKVESRTITRLQSFDQYEAIYTRQAKMLVNSICESLEERGYEVQTFAVPAASVGAPHKRERIWFVAYNAEYRRKSEFGVPPNSESHTRGNESRNDRHQPCSVSEERFNKPFAIAETKKRRAKRTSEWAAAHSDSIRLNGGIGEYEKQPSKGRKYAQRDVSPGVRYGDNPDTNILAGGAKQLRSSNGRFSSGIATDTESIGSGRLRNSRSPAGTREGDELSGGEYRIPNANYWKNWPTQPPVCVGDDGLSTELDGITFSSWRNESIKGGGNAVVPQVVLEFYKAIEKLIQDEAS